jgi:hypothetical protein
MGSAGTRPIAASVLNDGVPFSKPMAVQIDGLSSPRRGISAG